MPHALLTATTYGTWLPGDPRGSVTSVRDYRATDAPTRFRIEHDQPGQPYETALPGLQRSAQQLLKARVVLLTAEEARLCGEAMIAKASERAAPLLALSVMRNHFHAVVAFEGYLELSRFLATLKSAASASLNQTHRLEKWWTRGGSTRILPDARAVETSTNYVLNKQPNPLVRWSSKEGFLEPRT